MMQLLMVIFRKPPVDSVPNLSALQWLLRMQLVMVICSDKSGGSAFQRNAIVIRITCDIADGYIAATIDIHHIVVAVGMVPDIEPIQFKELAAEIMLHPECGVPQAQSVYGSCSCSRPSR